MAVTGSISIAEINDAIKDTLAGAAGLTYAQSYNELTEGINDSPILQVYWQSHRVDPISQTSQTTFRAVVRQTSLVFFADLYPRQRSHIDEDMGALLPLVDAIDDILEAQRVKPYFGLAGIEAIEGWEAQQVLFENPPNDVKFLGARFTIRLRVF
jgi:hypothetical protein